MRGVLGRWCYLVFAISGMTALIYEIVWVRQLQLILGSSNYAVSIMLTSVMLGFALGSYLFRNTSSKTKNPLFLFSYLQLAIGIYGLLSILLFSSVASVALQLLKAYDFRIMPFILSFLFLIIPTTMFGATWPTITQACARQSTIGKDTGKLYSSNSLGCTFGALIAGFLLLPSLGISKTIILASLINISLAIFVFTYAKKRGNNEIQ